MVKRLICVVCFFGFILGAIGLWGYQKPILLTSSEIEATVPIVWVDAGHGGLDSGTSGKDGTAEKTINLAIAQKVKDALSLLGFQVLMTREDDALLNHQEDVSVRQNKRNDIRARLQKIEATPHCVVLSIHQNFYTDGKYDGAQVFYNTENTENQLLAKAVQTAIVQNLQPENQRVVKTIGSEIYLLDHCTKPAIMVECGFMSNQKELSLLKNESYQAKMAFCIAMGLLSYYNAK